MLLFVTYCDTDWKGRPNHKLEFLGEGTREELLRKIDEDVREFQIADLIADAVNEAEEAEQEISEEALLESFRNDPDVAQKWKNEERWEMKPLMPAIETETPRQFVLLHASGDTSTLIYHLVDSLRSLSPL